MKMNEIKKKVNEKRNHAVCFIKKHKRAIFDIGLVFVGIGVGAVMKDKTSRGLDNRSITTRSFTDEESGKTLYVAAVSPTARDIRDTNGKLDSNDSEIYVSMSMENLNQQINSEWHID